MKEINVEVITPAKKAYEDKALSITIPGTKGSFQVLFNHAPLLSSFEIGKIKIVDSSNKTHIFATGGGTSEVRENNVLILAESFEAVEKIDVQRAENALNRAKERLAHKDDHSIDVKRAELALKRAMNRLKLAHK